MDFRVLPSASVDSRSYRITRPSRSAGHPVGRRRRPGHGGIVVETPEGAHVSREDFVAFAVVDADVPPRRLRLLVESRDERDSAGQLAHRLRERHVPGRLRGRVEPERRAGGQVENERRAVLRPLAPEVPEHGEVERRLLDSVAPERHARAIAVRLHPLGRAEGIGRASRKERQEDPEQKDAGPVSRAPPRGRRARHLEAVEVLQDRPARGA